MYELTISHDIPDTYSTNKAHNIYSQLESNLAKAEALTHQATQLVTQALTSTDWRHRWAATKALVQKKQVKPIPGLLMALQDKAWIVRHTALTVFENMGNQAMFALPTIIKTLTDEKWLVRCSAAKTLGKIGYKARHALPALRKATCDEHSIVRVYASQAIYDIEKNFAAI